MRNMCGVEMLKMITAATLAILITVGSRQASGQFNYAFPSDGTKCSVDVELDVQPFQKIGERYFYIESSEKVTWLEAVESCRRKGAYLADIETKEEIEKISDILIERDSREKQHIWIGGNDKNIEGKFFSISTGHPLKFYDWMPGEPNNYGGNEHCMCLWNGKQNYFKMNDCNCSPKHNYICELKPRKFLLTVW